jgi:hypothetical protein
MKTLLLSLLTAGLVLSARAQAPEGTFSYDFAADSGGALWNFTGIELFDPSLATVDRQDGWGDLWSNGDWIGSVYGDGRSVRVRATIFDSWWEETYYPWGGKAVFQNSSLNLTLDTNALALAGTQVLRERVVDYGRFFRHTLSNTTDRSDVSFALPEGNDGHWNLQLTLTPHGTYLSGDAVVTFANGETQEFHVSGKYSSFSDRTRLLLTSTWRDRGSMLWVNLVGPDLDIESLKGRVSGQKVLFP